jgi:hypothetical protein
MVQMYEQTGDPRIAPSIISYNTLMNAWGKSMDPQAANMAEKVLNEMMTTAAVDSELKPDASECANLILQQGKLLFAAQ